MSALCQKRTLGADDTSARDLVRGPIGLGRFGPLASPSPCRSRCRPRHLWPSIFLEDFDHQSRIVGEDDASLHHPQQAHLMFSLAERAACIHGDVSVEALAHRGDGRECSTDFERETRKNQLLASGGFYSMRDRRIVEGVDRGTIDNLDAGQTSTSSGIVGPTCYPGPW